MTKEEIRKARILLEYGRNLMSLVEKTDTQHKIDLTMAAEQKPSIIRSNLIEEIELKFDSMDDGYVLNNTYEAVKDYHHLTLNALNDYLNMLYTKKDNDAVLYVIKKLISVRDIVCSYSIDQFNADNNLVNFDFRMYFKAVTSFVVETMSESLDFLINRLNSELMLNSFILEGIDCLKRIHVFTKTCRKGDEWDASLFELEQLESGNYTHDDNLINKVCKIYRRVYMIRYGNTYYKLVPGIVSVWRAI